MKKLLSVLLVVAMLFGMLATSVFSAAATDSTETTYRGTAYTAGTNTNINFAEGDYDILTFDYILTTEGQIAIAIRSPGDVPYYGLYYFNASARCPIIPAFPVRHWTTDTSALPVCWTVCLQPTAAATTGVMPLLPLTR